MRTRLLAIVIGAGTSLPAPSYLAIASRPPVAVAPATSGVATDVPVAPPSSAASPPAGSADAAAVTPVTMMVNVHTGESSPLDDEQPTEARFSEMLQDRVTGARIELDPRLLALLRKIAKAHPGARIELVSGFRSPKLNEMLRKKEHKVASHSQHSLGHAVDFRVVGMTPKEMRKELEKLGWKGGIGQYDKVEDRFVHADVGPDRRWRER